MHHRVLKEVKNEIAYPLKVIFESSLEKNILPNDWKSGNITPIYKKGKKCEVKNYRPVSITSIVGKILESIVRDSIIRHFHDNNLFSNKQYGFIKGRSTVSQLLTLMDKWTEASEQGGQIDVIYTDLEKAFDKVPHNQLVRKLRSYKINDNILKLDKIFSIGKKTESANFRFFLELGKCLEWHTTGIIFRPVIVHNIYK